VSELQIQSSRVKRKMTADDRCFAMARKRWILGEKLLLIERSRGIENPLTVKTPHRSITLGCCNHPWQS